MSPREKCLVVGGGLIGTHTAARLLDDGHEVTVVSRSFLTALAEHPEAGGRLNLVEAVLPLADGLDAAMEDAEIVFALVGSSTPALAESDAVASITGSLEPCLAILESMRRAGTKRLVVASSGGTVYGEASRHPTPEDEPLKPISLHGANLVALENYTGFFAREHGLEPIVLRYSNVYGPGGRPRHGQGVISYWCRALKDGAPLTLIGDDSVRRDFVFAGDAAEATIAAAFGAPRPATYNVGGGRSHTLAEVLEALTRVSGRDPKVERLPGRGIDVSATELDCAALNQATGWEPAVSLDDGLARTWEAIDAGSVPSPVEQQ
jgi:UDP-glucose 4-epimerase